MQKTLIDNSTDSLKMANILNECIKTDQCNEILIATGYWDLSGTDLLRENLTTFLQGGGQLHLLIGKEPTLHTSQYTNPSEELARKKKDILDDLINNGIKEEYHNVVNMLIDYTKADFEHSPIQIKIFKADNDGNGTNDFMHAKCYIFRNTHNEDSPTHTNLPIGIIGSSNFTYNGLRENAELNYLETDGFVIEYEGQTNTRKGHVQWFNDLWDKAEEWNKEFILDGLDKVRKKLQPRQPEMSAEESAQLTPYETYIKYLQMHFGDIADETVTAQLQSYLPEGFQSFEYQTDAVKQCFYIMRHYGGFFLADVVGLGKTVVALLIIKKFLDEAEQMGQARRVLVITPPAIRPAWEETIRQFDEQSDTKIKDELVRIVTTGSIGKLTEDNEEIFPQ